MKIEWKTVIRLLLALFRMKKSGVGSQDDGLEDGSQDDSLEDGSQDDGLEDGSQDDGLEDESQDDDPGGESQDDGPEDGSQDDGPEDGSQDESPEEEKMSCPMATRRAIAEGVAKIREFAEEHQLATSVVRALLTLLAELALSSLHGKVNAHVLDVMIRALRYEQERLLPAAKDDGLPHISGGSASAADGTSIFEIAAGSH